MSSSAESETYSYLGPTGTFTWAALTQVPDAAGKTWRSVNNVGEALDDVLTGRSVAAMIAIENSVEGGVTATQDVAVAAVGAGARGEQVQHGSQAFAATADDVRGNLVDQHDVRCESLADQRVDCLHVGSSKRLHVGKTADFRVLGK